jgi:mono/diheme cytochrome c family protein
MNFLKIKLIINQIKSKSVLVALALISFFGFKNYNQYEPKIKLEGYTIEEGFELKVIAAENQLKAPVAIDFDNKGRIWLVEMIGYMPNLEGIGEDEPTGRISILEDTDKNGVIDRSKIFMSKLVLPRALAHVYGGLLYTDGPKLWFVEIKNDKPGKKTLVDPVYAEGGNVEHSSNGLMMNIDNWIYNADYNYRYQLRNGKWIKEPTSSRGQWGISKDNFGRLYYNNNSTQLQTDFVLPNKATKNRYFKPMVSENQKLTNNKVYPIHATSVNRGYIKGQLDERGYLNEVTASCGPLVYRGGAFPEVYNQNAFVCVPEANLIKRNILNFENLKTTATQAIEGKEFIASTDEGFRPVNLVNGPDGAIYIVDMHRGIIQHRAYLSQYLAEQLASKKLDTMQNLGRIIKVTHINSALKVIPNLNLASSKELVKLLGHKNGWLRDRAQQLLIQKKDYSIVKDLIILSKFTNEYNTSVHALYVLEALNKLNFNLLNEIIVLNKQPETIAHILGLLERFASPQQIGKMKGICTKLFAENNATIDLYIANSLTAWLKISENDFMPVLAEIEKKYSTDKIVQEAVMSSLEGKESIYLSKMQPSELLKNNLNTAITNHQKNEMNPIYLKLKNTVDNRTNGFNLYRTICATCHGADGKGIADLAPPLKGSEYIDGSVKRLAAIVLHGLSGPITVDGKLYQLNNEMPALVNNTALTDRDIADLLMFTQNAFAKNTKSISVAEIKKLRDKKPIGGLPFNEKQLLEVDFDK